VDDILLATLTSLYSTLNSSVRFYVTASQCTTVYYSPNEIALRYFSITSVLLQFCILLGCGEGVWSNQILHGNMSVARLVVSVARLTISIRFNENFRNEICYRASPWTTIYVS